MQRKTLIHLGLTMIFGLSAGSIAWKVQANRTRSQAEPSVTVLVAVAKVAPWQLIAEPEKFFEAREYPQSQAPPKGIDSLDQLRDKGLNKAVEEGSPIAEDDLLTEGQVGLMGKVKPGERVVTIRVVAESLLGGFVLPGYRIDATFTPRDKGAESGFIIQDALVLAVDAQTHRIEGQAHIMASNVTLAVSSEDAARLTRAAGLGEFRITPRPLLGDKILSSRLSRPQDLERPLRQNSEDKGLGGVVTLPRTQDLPSVPEQTPRVEAPVRAKTYQGSFREAGAKVVFEIPDSDDDLDVTPATKPVVVAIAKIAPWVEIKEPAAWFEVRDFAESIAPKKALTRLDQLKGKRLNKAVGKGKPITEDDLLTSEQTGGRLPPRKRPVSIRVSAENLAEGKVLPGARVDVALSEHGNASPSKLILRNMLVLTIEAPTEHSEGKLPARHRNVTLAANPEEATRLALAATVGKVRLLVSPVSKRDEPR